MNRLLHRTYFLVLGFSLTWTFPCHGQADDIVSYNDDIKPILRRHCFKCHGNDEQNADLNLQNYATLLKGGSAGPVVKPGRPSGSVLFQAITAEDEGARIPGAQRDPMTTVNVDDALWQKITDLGNRS